MPSINIHCRTLLGQLNLVGEAQEKDRILNAFAHQYHSQQKKSVCSSDGYYALVTATLLLNTNLHAPV
jgi:Sec7-like guanine-nucleotide exchange factor